MVGVPVAVATLHRSWKVLLAMIAMMAVLWVIVIALGLLLLFVFPPGLTHYNTNIFIRLYFSSAATVSLFIASHAG
jgi:hypothetical protein